MCSTKVKTSPNREFHHSTHMVNLGCGDTFVDDPGWINFDFASTGPNVLAADLLGKIPLPDDSVSAVYSSHFLEHIRYDLVPSVLTESFRILKPGGRIRLVCPDFLEMAKEYIGLRESGLHGRAEFVMIEIIDQCVRKESGGRLAEIYSKIKDVVPSGSELDPDFIHRRTGYRSISQQLYDTDDPKVSWRSGLTLRSLAKAIARVRVNIGLAVLPPAYREHNTLSTDIGERHCWLWDFFQLKHALDQVGFQKIEQVDAYTSRIPDFPLNRLDLDPSGLPRKGVESLFIEAVKSY